MNTNKKEAKFPNNIKKLRMEKGIWKQIEFARKIGATQAAVSSWEFGYTMPSHKYIHVLMQILECSYEDLFITKNNENLPSGDVSQKQYPNLAESLDMLVDNFESDLPSEDENDDDVPEITYKDLKIKIVVLAREISEVTGSNIPDGSYTESGYRIVKEHVFFEA